MNWTAIIAIDSSHRGLNYGVAARLANGAWQSAYVIPQQAGMKGKRSGVLGDAYTNESDAMAAAQVAAQVAIDWLMVDVAAM